VATRRPAGRYNARVLRAARRFLLPALGLCAVTGLLFYDLCNAIYRCGCRSLWTEAARHCNVHAAHGPHCPLCEHAALGAAVFGLTLGGQALVLWLLRRRRVSLAAATLAAALAVPVAAVPPALGVWLLTDYPHFLAREARARLGVPAGPLRCAGAAIP
jgi:hypothetical protein